VNAHDAYLRRGYFPYELPFPHVLGADVVGEVARVGEVVSSWRAGDRVIVAPGFLEDPGDWEIRPENWAPSYNVGAATFPGNLRAVRHHGRVVLLGMVGGDTAELPISLLALSGQFPVVEERVVHSERLREIPDEAGRDAARICALNALAQIEATLGDWERLDTILRVEGPIACVPGWTGHAGVLNAASEFLQAVLGPRAGHARAVFGQVSLPMNAPVERVVTASVRPASFPPSAG
jgi:YjgF/chorismate_mutase-like, putative endoribonuclease/Alcohol dehydrogenase GroES-like domain